MSSDTDSRGLARISRRTSDERYEVHEEPIDHARADATRGMLRRLGVGVAATAALLVLFGVLPVAGFTFPLSAPMLPGLDGIGRSILGLIDITGVLVVVAALTVVALIRGLPYGIGVVITVSIGAVLTTALVRHWADGWVPTSALPSGQVTAVLAVVGCASLVVAPRFLPMVGGLGAVAVGITGVAAVITGSVTIVGVLAAVLVSAVWWAGGSAVMQFSPQASEREARNPFDTAALAVQRRMGRS